MKEPTTLPSAQAHRFQRRSVGMVGLLSASLVAAACSPDTARPDDPQADMAPGVLRCSEAPLPLQNAGALTLGETFYLPRPQHAAGCPMALTWEVASAPSGSLNRVYGEGAPNPRFTPDVPGSYQIRLTGVAGSELTLTAVQRTPAERFRNHYLTPLYGAERVGDELWVANGPAYTVTRLSHDGSGWKKLAEVTVAPWPAAVVGAPALPYGIVAQRGADTVGFIDRKRGILEDALWVGDEPTGLALSADAKRLYVSLATERAVAVVDLPTRTVVGRIAVGFDPRALVLSPDGSKLYVASYRSANLQDGPMGMRNPADDQDIWIVDTARLAVEKTIHSIAADLRALALSDDGSELYVAATDGDTLPPQTEPTAKPFVHQAIAVSVDPQSADYGKVRRSADLFRQASAGGKALVNPAGILRTGSTLWVAAESSDTVALLDAATLAERSRVTVGSGPRKLVALPDGSVAVHCFQSFELWVIGADGKVVQTVKLTDDPRPPAVALGERVFNRPGATFAANHACSSCHAETQNDGMVWRFGPNIWHNVRPLQLLAATTPIEWGAYVSSTENFGFQGPASIVGRPATTEEAEGLSAFLSSLLGAPRATGHTRLDGSYTEAALRGQELFEKKLPCAGCHAPPLYTNRAYVPSGKSGEPADVPSLLGVYRHGVYMVNGKPRSLEAAVDVALKYVSAQISTAERADLIEFLNELTPKGAAPLGIWPDIDSNRGVHPDVQPWVAFAEPVDDSRAEIGAQAEAAAHVTLEDASGKPVESSVRIEGGRLVLVPTQLLAAGQRYTFRVGKGLRFRSGGTLDADRTSDFTVAQPAAAELPGALTLSVVVPAMGPPPAPPPLTLALDLQPAAAGSLVGTLTLGPSQQQRVWLRLDGEAFWMQPFALPIPGRGTADAAQVSGKITMTKDEMGKKTVARIEGTLRLGAPGISVPGLVFTLTPR